MFHILYPTGGCAQAVAWKTGSFTYYLFDLENDPNETTNLYNSSPAMKLIQEELYSKLGDYTTRAVPAVGDTSEPSKICFVKWKDNNDFIIPWATPEEVRLISPCIQSLPPPILVYNLYPHLPRLYAVNMPHSPISSYPHHISYSLRLLTSYHPCSHPLSR